jgi:hypothetical protein
MQKVKEEAFSMEALTHRDVQGHESRFAQAAQSRALAWLWSLDAARTSG